MLAWNLESWKISDGRQSECMSCRLKGWNCNLKLMLMWKCSMKLTMCGASNKIICSCTQLNRTALTMQCSFLKPLFFLAMPNILTEDNRLMGYQEHRWWGQLERHLHLRTWLPASDDAEHLIYFLINIHDEIVSSLFQNFQVDQL